MNWLDILVLIIIAASVAGSFRKGLSREIIHLASVVLALFLACWFYGAAGSYLAPYLSSRQLANFFGFVIVLFAVIVLGHAVSSVVGRFLKITGLSFFDHLLGAAFGVVRGVLISVALIMAIMAFSPTNHRPDSVVNSRIAPYAVEAARAFAAMAPHELKEGFQKSYGDVKAAWEGAVKRGSRVDPAWNQMSNERQI
jgi:membrane protein required for colicin V production